jgi:hypothetical protein
MGVFITSGLSKVPGSSTNTDASVMDSDSEVEADWCLEELDAVLV